MANRNFAGVASLDRNVVVLAGTVTIGASSAVSASDLNGMTVAKTGTGHWTFTLDDKYTQLLGWNVSLLDSALVDAYIQATAETVASTKTFVVKYASGGGTTAADPASGAKLYVTLVLRNSSQDRKGA